MLSESALRMGLSPAVLSAHKSDPAAQGTGLWHQGNPDQEDDLVAFLKTVDVASFESEFLNSEKLARAEQKASAKIYPAVQVMALLQDRKSQKQLFHKNGLASAPWTAATTKGAVSEFVTRHGLPVVFKKRFFGYDGYGTFIVKTKKQLGEFLEQHWQDDLFIVEAFVPFKKECAIILARSLDASFTHLPLVESHQKDARCDWVKGPISHRSAKAMIAKLKKFLVKMDYVGVMGVEFFLTGKGLSINEIAPRVHNTGHYSLTTEGPSQFDLHNMCLLGLKLPKAINIKKGFAMANLIGSDHLPCLKPVDGL